MRKKIDKRILYPLAFIMLIIVSLLYKTICKGGIDHLTFPAGGRSNDDISIDIANKTDETELTLSSTEPEMTEERYVNVYVCGEVINPGVYMVKAGSILNDVVIMAGGMTSDAAAERINLVFIVEENLSIYIPSKAEADSSDIAGVSVSEPGIYNVLSTEDLGVAEHDPEGPSVADSGQIIPVNINTAGKDELMTLPGIGEVTAESIIEYRSSKPFEDIRDLMNVSGIGEGRYARISSLICVG